MYAQSFQLINLLPEAGYVYLVPLERLSRKQHSSASFPLAMKLNDFLNDQKYFNVPLDH